jgi:putative endonuclease
MHNLELGRTGEEVAARFLTARGWMILDRNVRFREGELDIIAVRDGLLAFVEVKTRRSRAFGTPAEAVTWKKAARIRRLAMQYLQKRHVFVAEVRFDVIDIAAVGDRFDVTYLEGAF